MAGDGWSSERRTSRFPLKLPGMTPMASIGD